MTPRVGLTMACVAVVAAMSLIVQQSVVPLHWAESAVIVRDGRPLRLDNALGRDPGLYLKVPFVETAMKVERRTQVWSEAVRDVRTGSGGWTNLTVDGVYRIADPMKFSDAAGGGSPRALRKSLEAAVRTAAARTPPQPDGSLNLSQTQRSLISRGLETRFGIVLESLTIAESGPMDEENAAHLAADVTQATDRLKAGAGAHRQAAIAQTARDVAAEGDDGERQALDIRGEGDAERAAILADAYGQDPDFARFFRRLEAYDQALDPANTTLVLSPDNAFLGLFGHGPGGTTRVPR